MSSLRSGARPPTLRRTGGLGIKPLWIVLVILLCVHGLMQVL